MSKDFDRVLNELERVCNRDLNIALENGMAEKCFTELKSTLMLSIISRHKQLKAQLRDATNVITTCAMEIGLNTRNETPAKFAAEDWLERNKELLK